MQYVFKDDQPIRLKNKQAADAQVIGDALEKIHANNGGELKPQAVVEAARSKRNPLHKHFEWDDQLAAEQYRCDQARHIIRSIRIVNEDSEEGTQRAYYSVNVAGAGKSYRSIGDIRKSTEFQIALLKQADTDLEAFERRYRQLTEVCHFVAEARKRIAAEMHVDI